MLVAGAGYGKTTIAEQLRSSARVPTAFAPLSTADHNPAVFVLSLRRAVRAAGMSDLAAAMGGSEPVEAIEQLLAGLATLDETPISVIIDDGHELSPPGQQLLAHLVRGFPRPHRLVVCTRDLDGVGNAFARRKALRLTEQDLAFTPKEVANLARLRDIELDDEHVVELLRRTTGWPTAVALLLAGDPVAPHEGLETVDAVLGSVLARLDDDDARTVVQLAHLPALSPGIVDAVGGPGTFLRLRRAGVPFAHRADGSWELPGPVTDRWRVHSALDATTAQAAVPALVAAGLPAQAVSTLIDAGCPDDAARLLGQLPAPTFDDIGLAVVEDLVDRLPDSAVAAHPVVLLRIAQNADTESEAGRERALRRLRALNADADPRVARQMAAERARELVWDERTRPEAVHIATRILAEAGPDELSARARALDVAGRCASWYLPFRPGPQAKAMLEESVRLARALGQHNWAAQALVPLAMGVYAANARYEAAVDALREALAELPTRSRIRAFPQSFLADVLAMLGRFEEAHAAAADVRELGQALHDERLLAYASWSDAIVCSYARDRGGTVAAVFDVERHRGLWFDQEAGAEFLAYAADLLDRVGEVDLARHYLARAHERGDAVSTVVNGFAAQVTARSGDAARADVLLTSILADQRVEPRDRPYYLLLRAWAAHRDGNPLARQLAATAFDALLELGDLSGVWLREPAVAAALLPLALGEGSSGARAVAAQRGHLTIATLGRFRVQRDGELIELPIGRPSRAIRLLVAVGGRIRADALIEELWPEVDPAVGRNRLRNLLSRLRAAAGPQLFDREGDVVSLNPHCQIDVKRFEELASRVGDRQASDDTVLSAATAALALYQGPFLPDDVGEAWADATRMRLRRRYLEVIDASAAIALRRDEIDEAIRLQHRGLDEEPDDDIRRGQLAQLLDDQGRHAAARQVRATTPVR